MSLATVAEDDLIKYGILAAVVLVAGYWIVKQIESGLNPTGSGGPGSVGNSVANAATGLLAGTGGGNNAIDNSYYQNAGVVGTLAATANSVSGGSLASFGSWIGGKLADAFQPYSPNGGAIPTSNQNTEQSGSIQSSSNRPYQNGPNAAYADAVDSSPVDPSYAASPLTDTGSWD